MVRSKKRTGLLAGGVRRDGNEAICEGIACPVSLVLTPAGRASDAKFEKTGNERNERRQLRFEKSGMDTVLLRLPAIRAPPCSSRPAHRNMHTKTRNRFPALLPLAIRDGDFRLDEGHSALREL
ncbi:unnamed protein product [Bursaphelenchus okinawaensis]|uniref:Uncharacterized protein n=1 Tax=Bursaphelenchus okinawaensis TaxID=465554 RepID=A0A811KIR8_9BILA|nr:unnamed protein product [Bursaphelenchus okinawaensis]CAG9103753.1 unnamed protein product [Bursaphelenchus okinawaensis]